ncbi:MAG: NUDIX domain-containing protein [Eubacteriales bacterium]|nr:NUDIX domain-containing protein [Eubacteriales bacterium]
MSGYIMDLRQLVGHRPLLQCGASVIVENDKGEVLLQRRADNHLLGYCGGSVELYEVVEDAARRELLEETGLCARELTMLGVFSGPELRYTYPNGDQVSTIDVVFVCKQYSGTLTPQWDEVEELRFFAPDALPRAMTSSNVPALRAYLAQKGLAW